MSEKMLDLITEGWKRLSGDEQSRLFLALNDLVAARTAYDAGVTPEAMDDWMYANREIVSASLALGEKMAVVSAERRA